MRSGWPNDTFEATPSYLGLYDSVRQQNDVIMSKQKTQGTILGSTTENPGCTAFRQAMTDLSLTLSRSVSGFHQVRITSVLSNEPCTFGPQSDSHAVTVKISRSSLGRRDNRVTNGVFFISLHHAFFVQKS